MSSKPLVEILQRPIYVGGTGPAMKPPTLLPSDEGERGWIIAEMIELNGVSQYVIKSKNNSAHRLAVKKQDIRNWVSQRAVEAFDLAQSDSDLELGWETENRVLQLANKIKRKRRAKHSQDMSTSLQSTSFLSRSRSAELAKLGMVKQSTEESDDESSAEAQVGLEEHVPGKQPSGMAGTGLKRKHSAISEGSISSRTLQTAHPSLSYLARQFEAEGNHSDDGVEDSGNALAHDQLPMLPPPRLSRASHVPAAHESSQGSQVSQPPLVRATPSNLLKVSRISIGKAGPPRLSKASQLVDVKTLQSRTQPVIRQRNDPILPPMRDLGPKSALDLRVTRSRSSSDSASVSSVTISPPKLRSSPESIIKSQPHSRAPLLVHKDQELQMQEDMVSQRRGSIVSTSTTTSTSSKTRRKKVARKFTKVKRTKTAKEASTEWDVKGILEDEIRLEKGKKVTYYRVDWEGDWDPTWEPESNISADVIDAYQRMKQGVSETQKNRSIPVDETPNTASADNSDYESILSSTTKTSAKKSNDSTNTPFLPNTETDRLAIQSTNPTQRNKPGSRVSIASSADIDSSRYESFESAVSSQDEEGEDHKDSGDDMQQTIGKQSGEEEDDESDV